MGTETMDSDNGHSQVTRRDLVQGTMGAVAMLVIFSLLLGGQNTEELYKVGGVMTATASVTVGWRIIALVKFRAIIPLLFVVGVAGDAMLRFLPIGTTPAASFLHDIVTILALVLVYCTIAGGPGRHWCDSVWMWTFEPLEGRRTGIMAERRRLDRRGSEK